MGEPHVISGLRAKRDEVARRIHAVEDHLKRLRASLAHIDAIIPLFEPGDDDPDILARPIHRRSRYFASGEVVKRCRDALRKAGRPLSSVEIADYLMAAKGMATDDPQLRRYIADSVLPVVRRLVRRGVVGKSGKGSATRWEIIGRVD
jgi:hypothetical protein